jgi:hypothetical protein
MADLPPYLEALKAQRSNLDRFVAAHRAEFAAMRYVPWTAVWPSVRERAAELRGSTLVPGLLGTYLAEPFSSR